MTTIAASRPVVRETAVRSRGRVLVAEMHAGFVALHEKGRRQSVEVDWGAVYDLGWKLRARADAREKAKGKLR